MKKVNLIGISGKKQSGKDTVGKIIQYLIDKEEVRLDSKHPDREYWLSLTFEQYLTHKMSFSNWKIKKFAYRLKQVLSILTGIPVEDFEREEVKQSYLGEEWARERLICGCEDVGIETYIDDNGLCYNCGNPAEKYIYTVREAMQQFGTNLMRNQFHPNCWTNALFADYKSAKPCLCGGSGVCFQPKEYLCNEPPDNWIISDVRFENECQAVKGRGGILIRVNRDNMPERITKAIEETGGYMAKEHPSETALDNYEGFDYIIDNNADIPALIEKVRTILEKENLL